jgi:hypothetical protein
MEHRVPALGDLIAFALGPASPNDFGLVVDVNESFVNILWPWGLVECSKSSFMGERWGNLKVVTDEG